MNTDTKTITLAAVGDISLVSEKTGNPFSSVLSHLTNADITFGNLETAISSDVAASEKAVVLTATPGDLNYLSQSGFDIVNIANNHIYDTGQAGFRQTIKALEKKEVKTVGAGIDTPDAHFETITRGSLTIGFLAYTESYGQRNYTDCLSIDAFYRNEKFLKGKSNILQCGSLPADICISQLDTQHIQTDVRKHRDNCDLLIVSLHWGVENVWYPAPHQIELARTIARSGADAVLGHHPHIVQGIEQYEGTLIAYSLGNFQFDPVASNSPSRNTIILNITFSPEGVEDHSITPVRITADNTPVLMSEAQAANVHNNLEEISNPVKMNNYGYKEWFEEIAPTYLENHTGSYWTRLRQHGLSHFPEFFAWAVTPFCLRCYSGLLSAKLPTSAGSGIKTNVPGRSNN